MEPIGCPVKVGSALAENLRPREHKDCGIVLLIYDGGVAGVKISEWLQVHGTCSSHYASICGADGNTWAEKGTSPHCTPYELLDGARTEGWHCFRMLAAVVWLFNRRACRT